MQLQPEYFEELEYENMQNHLLKNGMLFKEVPVVLPYGHIRIICNVLNNL